MKNLTFVLLALIVLCGCAKSTSPDNTAKITIEILQNGVKQDSYEITEEDDGNIYPVMFEGQQIGEVEIDVYEYCPNPPSEDNSVSFLTIARKEGFYTKFTEVNHFDTLRIDYQHDFDTIEENLNCGTMFDLYDGPIKNTRFSVWKDSIFVDSLFTDEMGRFATDIAAGEYTIKFEPSGDYFWADTLQIVEGYSDYYIGDYYVVDCKPNIYLYPESEITLDVEITFPHSGEVIVSIPQYPEKWKNLRVEPNGTINGEYEYLFYESIQPNVFQRDKGWVIASTNLEEFFKENLRTTGFNQIEINDFIEYWIPRLTDSEFYVIYPQYNKQLDPLIKLQFSKQPDSILRLTYVVEEVKSDKPELALPEIPSFVRSGFVITEWGLVPVSKIELLPLTMHTQ